MTFESVLAWDSVKQTLPSESSAAITDNRGLTVLSGTLVDPSLGAQAFRMWLVSLSQVSSTLMILLPVW